jgi:hypothetical protein
VPFSGTYLDIISDLFGCWLGCHSKLFVNPLVLLQQECISLLAVNAERRFVVDQVFVHFLVYYSTISLFRLFLLIYLGCFMCCHTMSWPLPSLRRLLIMNDARDDIRGPGGSWVIFRALLGCFAGSCVHAFQLSRSFCYFHVVMFSTVVTIPLPKYISAHAGLLSLPNLPAQKP